jgi:LysR family transcriptional regulator, glycine cleavage system transcriptional activator
MDKAKLTHAQRAPRMHPRNLPLAALRTFESAARHLSFKQAAEELCVSATTVSNQIRRLEQELGCKLFIRRTRAVVLTDAGRSLSRVLSRSLEDIRLEVETHMRARRKSVSLAVGPIFGSRWMIPRLDRFGEDLPGIDIELRNSPRITDASMMTADIAIDWGMGQWVGLENTPLFEIVYSPVLSPALAERLGMPTCPEEVARFPVIHQQDRHEWQEWLKVAGCAGMPLTDKATIVDTNVVIQAAIAGQGMALGIFPFCQSEVDSGRLIKPFDIDLTPTRSFHLLTRPGARQRREIDEVCKWMIKEAALNA